MRRSCMGPEKNIRSIFKINHPDWENQFCLSDLTRGRMDIIRDDICDIVEFDWDNEMTLAKFLYPNFFWDLGECETKSELVDRFMDLPITKTELNKTLINKMAARFRVKRLVSELFKENGKGTFGFIHIDGDGLLSVPKKINEYAENRYGREKLFEWFDLPIFSGSELYRKEEEDDEISTVCISIKSLNNGWPPLELNTDEEYYQWVISENYGPVIRATLPYFKYCGDVYVAGYGAKNICKVEYIKTKNNKVKKGFKYLIGIKDDELSGLVQTLFSNNHPGEKFL